MVRSRTVHTRFVPPVAPPRAGEADARPDGAAFERLLSAGGAPAGPRGEVCLDARDLDLDDGIVTFRPRSRA